MVRFFILSTLLLLLSCSRERLTPMQKARQQSLRRLQQIHPTEIRTLQESLPHCCKNTKEVRSTFHQHHALLSLCFGELGRNSSFHLFQQLNAPLTNTFMELSQIHLSPTGTTELLHKIDTNLAQLTCSVDTSYHRSLLKITHADAATLQQPLLNSSGTNRYQIEQIPLPILRLIHTMDLLVPPSCRSDELYCFIREQLLNFRSYAPLSARDILELKLNGDTLYAEGQRIGLLSELQDYSSNKTVKQFEDILIDFTTRNHGIPAVVKESVPTFTIDSVSGKRVPLRGAKALSRGHRQGLFHSCTNAPAYTITYDSTGAVVLLADTVAASQKQKRLTGIDAILAGSGLRRADLFGSQWGKDHFKEQVKAYNQLADTMSLPLYDSSMVSIQIDASVSSSSLLWLLEILQGTTGAHEYTILSKGNRSVHFRTVRGATSHTTITLPYFEQHPSSALLFSRDLINPVTLVSLQSTISTEELIPLIKRASRARIARLQFDTSFALPSLYTPSSEYSCTNKLLIGESDITETTRLSKNRFSGVVLGMGGTGKGFKEKKRKTAPTKAFTGNRSRARVMRILRKNMFSLKDIYNQNLKNRHYFHGKLTVHWLINANGEVIFCEAISSTTENPAFDQQVIKTIKSWDFGKIDVPRDTTTVTYPFIFRNP